MGIEKDQITAVAKLFHGDETFVPAPDLYDPAGKTPNQHALACAVGLAWSRLGPPRGAKSFSAGQAQAQTLALFQAMRAVGHQAVAPDYGCEQGCPDPHAGLWMGALATILREARLQELDEILRDAVGYFADHFALCSAFWTPAGVRTPCARAKPVSGKPLRPNWSVDSMAYAVVHQLPTAGLAKPDALTIDILRDSASLFPQILRRQPELELFVPIRRWDRSAGGFVAALVRDVPMNDRLSWLVVDMHGGILDAGDTLDNLAPPAGSPVVVGDGSSQAPTLTALADRVAGLKLARKERAKQAAIVAELRRPLTRPLAAIADDVERFGIGPGQPQKAEQNAVVAALRELAG
jgi:hypothetical protein